MYEQYINILIRGMNQLLFNIMFLKWYANIIRILTS